MSEREIVAYCVAREGTQQYLEQEVSRLIDIGWQPFGNLVATQFAFMQPMVKYRQERGYPRTG